jgi:hypothetical protein
MNLEAWLGLVRHLLTFGGGFLVSAGYASGDEVTAGVSALAALVGVVWSVIQKVRA